MRGHFAGLASAAAVTIAACGGSNERPASNATPPTSPKAETDGGLVDAKAEGAASSQSGGWLAIKGNRILLPNGAPFHGRGANLFDTRSCNACTTLDPDPAGVERWSDELIDGWHANFVRFLLESFAASDGYRKQWQSMSIDGTYLAAIKEIVHHIAAKSGFYVMVTLFEDPAIKPESADPESEWPTDASRVVYAKLAEAFFDESHVLFGLTNEPHGPPDRDDALAARYQNAIDTIRAVEAAHGTPKHVIVVQAPENYSRDLSYFVKKPMPGENIAYEIHPYNPKTDFDRLIVQPSKTLPILIGEYGPAATGGSTAMTEDDVRALWPIAQANEIPHIAWNFHHRCPPNLLADTAIDHCGLAASTGYAFPRTAWGDMLHDYLAIPW